MQLRRPIAAVVTALALFTGGATMTACQAAGQDQNDGTTEPGVPSDTATTEPSGPTHDNLPNNSDTSGSVDQGKGEKNTNG